MNNNKSSVFYLLVLLCGACIGPSKASSADLNPLPDTGIDYCMDNGNFIDCPSRFGPFYGQDAQYASTRQLSFWNNDNGTVTDENTGLMWQTLSFFDKGWSESVDYCSQLGLAGFTDWRLPEIFEWVTLANFKRLNPVIEPIIEAGGSYGFWSATPLSGDSNQVWVFDPGRAPTRSSEISNKEETKCVRGEKQTPVIYTSNGNTVTDTQTFLTWQQSDDGQGRDWEDALAYCESLFLDGKRDWRLPNAKELMSLVDFTSGNPAINDIYFTGASDDYWTSTPSRITYTGHAQKFIVKFETGRLTMTYGEAFVLARCVRDGLFGHPRLSVMLSGSGDGSVQGVTVPGGSSIIDCGAECTYDPPHNEVVKLTATPQAGSTFVRWAGDFAGGDDCDGDTGVCTIQMLEDTQVLAYFMPHKLLTVTRDGLGDGLVVDNHGGIVCVEPLNDCDHVYPFATDVTLSATAATGSTFWYWSGEGCSGNGDCTVSMSMARNVTATFAPQFVILRPLTVTKPGNSTGNVSSSPAGIDCGTDCFNTYPDNTVVTLTATPEPGSVFSRWTRGPFDYGTDLVLTVTMDESWDLEAEFAIDITSDRMLSVTIQDGALGESGSITSLDGGIDCGTDCTESYAYNTSVTLTSTPNNDASFVEWSGGGCTGSAPECIVTMDNSWQVTAAFGPPPVQKSVSVTKDGNGTGTVSSSPLPGIDCGADCTNTYPLNSWITLTATPDAGMNFLGWGGGGCMGTGDCDIFMMGNTFITASFAVDPNAMQELTVVKDGSGTGLVTSIPAGIDCGASCSADYPMNAPIILLANADKGSEFAGWSGDIDGTCSGSDFCIVTMDQARDIQAHFYYFPWPMFLPAIINNTQP